MNKFILVFLLLCSSYCSMGQPSFIPNIGQWNDNFKYKMEYSSGALFFDNNSIVYTFMNKADLKRLHDYELHQNADEPITAAFLADAPPVNAYAYKVIFEGALTEQIIPNGKKHTYHNYYLGSDSKKWKSRVPLYEELSYKELYKGIDLKYYQHEGRLKYDLIVAPDADVTELKLRYDGIKPQVNSKGALLLNIGFDIITEQAPYCYQIINGKKIEIPSAYTLKNETLGFTFPQGYNKNYPLIIDPAIIFKSYSGSTAYTTGYTSGHDNNGRLCITGEPLGPGLPTTMGAFQVAYSGNNANGDIGISVYNINGTQQDYVTYLGGNGWESPGQIRFNNNNNLIIVGSSSSVNFPTTPGCFDNVPPNGGNASKNTLSVFNADGTQLLASTYLGSGGNFIEVFELDQNQNIIAAGRGAQFPYVFPANAYQTTSAGGTDNVLMKFNPALTQMIAATYFGGTGTDLLKDIAYNKVTNEIITLSMVVFGNGMAATANAFSNTGEDFICRFNSDLTQVLTVAHHMQTKQVDCDGAGNIYIMGKGDPAVSPGVYSHVSGEGYVKKISADLSTELLSTQVGGSSINSPINMQVSDCGYVCLFSMLDDPIFGPFTTDADFSANAFQTTQGSFYYEVLEPEFAAHPFATILGSNEQDHVHSLSKNNTGKTQTQYWGTCTESPNWWQTPGCAQTTGPAAGGFDMAGMKFDLEFSLGSGSGATISLLPNDTICIGDTLFLAGIASPTATIHWDFGDGTQSAESNPAHLYTTPGIYQVSYSLSDPLGCVTHANDSVKVYVFQPDNITITPGDTIVCNAKTPLNISVTGGKSYLWSPETAVDNPTAPTVHLNNDGTYHLSVTVTHNGGCISTHDVNISQYNIHAEAGPDHVIVPGKSVMLDGSASYGASILWDSHPTVADVNNLTPTVTPSVTTWYYINAEGGEHCKARDSALVTVVGLGLPNAFSPNGDGLNDIFKLITNDEDNVKVKIDIYNRFGQRVFHTPNVKKGWDGTFHGKPCDLGVYFYHITAVVGDTEYEFKGDVSLMR